MSISMNISMRSAVDVCRGNLDIRVRHTPGITELRSHFPNHLQPDLNFSHIARMPSEEGEMLLAILRERMLELIVT
jgi:hypothetical protein